MNQRRSWPKVKAGGASAGRRTIGGAADALSRAATMRAARPATVGCSNTSRQGQLDIGGALERRHQPGGEQGVAAQAEEVGVAGYAAVVSEQPREHRRDLLLVGAAGRLAFGGEVGLRQRPARQGLAIGLAVGQHRQGVERHEAGRHHVGRQARGQVAAEHRVEVVLGPGAGDHREGDQGRLAAGAVVQHHHAFADDVVGGQRGLDLAELDAQAAQLDLVVDPTQVLEGAIGTPAGAIAGGIDAAFRAMWPGGRARSARRSAPDAAGSPGRPGHR